MRAHEVVYNFRCPYPKCGKGYNVQYKYQQHLATHTAKGDPPPPPPGAEGQVPQGGYLGGDGDDEDEEMEE